MPISTMYRLNCNRDDCNEKLDDWNNEDCLMEEAFDRGWEMCDKCGGTFCPNHVKDINEPHGNLDPGPYYFKCEGEK